MTNTESKPSSEFLRQIDSEALSCAEGKPYAHKGSVVGGYLAGRLKSWQEVKRFEEKLEIAVEALSLVTLSDENKERFDQVGDGTLRMIILYSDKIVREALEKLKEEK